MPVKHGGLKDFALDQLSDRSTVRYYRMLGGYGVTHRTAFFGIRHKDRSDLTVTLRTIARHENHGMEPLRPDANSPSHHSTKCPSRSSKAPSHESV